MASTATRNKIDITHELTRRRPRSADHRAEAEAYRTLATQLGTSSSTSLLQSLSEIALDLCKAHSAGVSVLEDENGEQVFKWRGLAGRWAHYLNGGLPRHASPCGMVLDLDRTLLVSWPGREFVQVAQAQPALVEGLLAPFRILGQPIGTVWVLAHDEHRHFDAEDARVVEGLAAFAAASFMLIESLKGALDSREELVRSHARLLRTNDQLWTRLNSVESGSPK
jgi:GAF domain-containing protein